MNRMRWNSTQGTYICIEGWVPLLLLSLHILYFFLPHQTVAGLGVVLIYDMTHFSIPGWCDALCLLVVDTEFNFFNQNVFYKSLLILRRWFFPPKSYSFFSEKNGCDAPLPRYWKCCTKSVSTSVRFIVLPNWWFQPILKTHHFWGEGNLVCVAIPASRF